MENDYNKVPAFFRFEDLRIYDKSLVYVDWVYDVTKMFPDESAKDLISRFNAASRAISIYIAEGSARNKPQFITSLKMAKSCIRECIVYTTISSNQAFLTETLVEESRLQLMDMTKMIGALIGSLQRPNGNYQKSKEKTETFEQTQLTERLQGVKN